MCDLATASLVATGLGTAASYEAGQQSKNAMSKAQQAENERQKKMRGQANELFNESLGTEGQGNAVRSEDKAIQDRQDAAKAAMATGTGVDSGSAYGNKSTVVSDESGVRSAAGKASAGMEAAAKARMAGFGDAAQLNAIKNARMRLGQGIISGNMAGSAAALAPELDYASHAGDSMKNLGAGLSTVGMLTGMAAAAGAGATTAEELANAQAAEQGGVLGADKTTTLTGTKEAGGATGVFDLKTGQWTPIKDVKNIDWSNWAPKANLDWANKPAFMKMFGNAPAGYVAAPSWFSKIK